MIDIVGIAKKIAITAHNKQLRWDNKTPYIIHLEAVANGVQTEEAKAVAWLHDVLEDTAFTPEDLLANGVPQDIVDKVKLITKAPWQDYLEYIITLKNDSIVKYVKISDIKHNLSDLNPVTNKNRHLKYRMALYILEH